MNLWGRLGLSVAIVAVFTIVMTGVLQDTAFYQAYRRPICAGFLATGGFLLVIGKFVNAKLHETDRSQDDETPTGPFIFANIRYWGLMLTIFGLIVAVIVPQGKIEARAAAVAPAPTNQVNPGITNTAPEPPLPNPVVFPKVKLQGIVIKQDTASVLLNGRTYFLGDSIGEAKVVAITATNAVLEMEGQQRVLVLPD